MLKDSLAREQIFKIPQEFSVLEALMLEPLGVAIHAVDLAKPGKRVLETMCMVGCGPIGLKVGTGKIRRRFASADLLLFYRSSSSAD